MSLAVSQANRARGLIRARFTRTGTRTAAARLHAAGGLRLRCPTVGPGLTPDCEAVLINTAGGMVGGDHASIVIEAAAGASVTLTTQSAEKIYRSTGAATLVDTTLRLEAGSHLEWLPQETILFDRVAFGRSLDAAMTGDATLLLVESLVFGRLAMGEVFGSGTVRDRWRIRRDGALVFAEELHIAGDAAGLLERSALGGGARAVATLLLVAPDAEARLPAVREALAGTSCPGGASAWNGLLLTRLLSPSPALMRTAIIALLASLRGRAAPRVWQ